MTLSIRDPEATQVEPCAVAGIGDILKKAREAIGYSLEDLGETSGLTTVEIRKIEDGADLDPGRVRRIASALRFDLTPRRR